jgi:hypothetical protein
LASPSVQEKYGQKKASFLLPVFLSDRGDSFRYAKRIPENDLDSSPSGALVWFLGELPRSSAKGFGQAFFLMACHTKWLILWRFQIGIWR